MKSTVLPGALVVLLVIAAAGAGYVARGAWTPAVERRVPASASPAGGSLADGLQAGFVGVAEHVRPAVVNLDTIQKARRPRASGAQPAPDDPFFQDFFKQFFGPEGPSGGGEFRQRGLGSGVIFDKRGLLLTNFHVIKGADEIVVRLSDKREYRGQVVGTDPKTDLAVIRIQPDHDLTVAALGNSDALRVGEWAIAIGNPFGLAQTVTVGVISATGRSDVGVATYENFIQTDASINPGNSGGPLVNLKGEIIGINTAIVATGQGIGFAIPANMVKRVTAQLIDRGKVTRGWIGIAMEPLTTELAQALGVRDARGAVVARVYPGGPAAAAGLVQNDVIVAFDGTAIEDYHHLQRLSADAEVGKMVKLGIMRSRERRTLELRIAEAPDRAADTALPPREPR